MPGVCTCGLTAGEAAGIGMPGVCRCGVGDGFALGAAGFRVVLRRGVLLGARFRAGFLAAGALCILWSCCELTTVPPTKSSDTHKIPTIPSLPCLIISCMINPYFRYYK